MIDVFRGLQLGSGMPHKSSRHFIFRNAAAVVGDPDQFQSASAYLYADCIGPRVNGIVQKFLHNALRTFRDLAGSDLIYGFLTENMDHGNYP